MCKNSKDAAAEIEMFGPAAARGRTACTLLAWALCHDQGRRTLAVTHPVDTLLAAPPRSPRRTSLAPALPRLLPRAAFSITGPCWRRPDAGAPSPLSAAGRAAAAAELGDTHQVRSSSPATPPAHRRARLGPSAARHRAPRPPACDTRPGRTYLARQPWHCFRTTPCLHPARHLSIIPGLTPPGKNLPLQSRCQLAGSARAQPVAGIPS